MVFVGDWVEWKKNPSRCSIQIKQFYCAANKTTMITVKCGINACVCENVTEFLPCSIHTRMKYTPRCGCTWMHVINHIALKWNIAFIYSYLNYPIYCLKSKIAHTYTLILTDTICSRILCNAKKMQLKLSQCTNACILKWNCFVCFYCSCCWCCRFSFVMHGSKRIMWRQYNVSLVHRVHVRVSIKR